MTTKIPPCPVCGVVPPFDSGPNCDPTKLWASCNCITAPDLYDPWQWEHACMRELGWALRSHGIETVAQVDRIARFDPEWQAAIDATRKRNAELEAELAKARGAVNDIYLYVEDMDPSTEKRRILQIIEDAAAPTEGQEVKG